MPHVVVSDSREKQLTEEILLNEELMTQLRESEAAKKKGVKPWKIHL